MTARAGFPEAGDKPPHVRHGDHQLNAAHGI
jgi:hypothetical protein